MPRRPDERERRVSGGQRRGPQTSREWGRKKGSRSRTSVFGGEIKKKRDELFYVLRALNSKAFN